MDEWVQIVGARYNTAETTKKNQLEPQVIVDLELRASSHPLELVQPTAIRGKLKIILGISVGHGFQFPLKTCRLRGRTLSMKQA